jgi:hypothetical protein
MSRWFRVYDDLIDDPKFIKLSMTDRSTLVMVWCLASKNNGKLPPIEDIAIAFRVPKGKALKRINSLRSYGLIDEDCPHNWNGRQYKSDVSTERVKRFRKRHETVTETAPDTESESDTETDKKERKKPSGLATRYSIEFEEFWIAYPRTPVMSKKEAFRAWKGLSEDDQKAATTSLVAYKAFLASKPDHPAVHACRFLSQRRFDGFAHEATGPPANGGWRPGLPTSEEIRAEHAKRSEMGKASPLVQNGDGSRKDEQELVRGHTRKRGVQSLANILRSTGMDPEILSRSSSKANSGDHNALPMAPMDGGDTSD